MNEMEDPGFRLESVSKLQIEGLLNELNRRTMVVPQDALTHLVAQGALARLAAGGCCKPDGGTCCPNKKIDGGLGVVLPPQQIFEP